MSLKSKLRKLIDEAGRGTASKLATHLGISPVYVSRYADEKYQDVNMPRDYIKPTADFFGVPIAYLLDDNDNSKPVKFIPIIGTASCGGAEINFLQDSSKKALYHAEYWKSSLYCVIANGDSMSPEIDDGDEVIVDPDVKCSSGDMVHYKLDEESAIKVLVIDTEAHLLQFIPYNSSDNFKTKTIRLDDEETISKLTYFKVVSVNKLKYNNRAARLKMIGR